MRRGGHRGRVVADRSLPILVVKPRSEPAIVLCLRALSFALLGQKDVVVAGGYLAKMYVAQNRQFQAVWPLPATEWAMADRSSRLEGLRLVQVCHRPRAQIEWLRTKFDQKWLARAGTATPLPSNRRRQNW